MATPEAARSYAQLLVDPRVQQKATADDRTPERNLDFLASAFERLPAAVLNLLVQTEHRIAPIREGHSIVDYDSRFANDVERRAIAWGLDETQKNEFIADVTGLQVTGGGGPDRIYVTDYKDGTLVHEVAHAVDSAIGIMVVANGQYHAVPNSVRDPMILGAYAVGNELLNEYAKISPSEAFAEWFRASLGVQDQDFDRPGVDVRRNSERNAPIMTSYVDNLIESLEIALEIDPHAFSPDATIDTDLYVNVRARIALDLNIPARDVDMEELLQLRDDFVGRLELALGDAGPRTPSPVNEPPTSRPRLSISNQSQRELVAVSSSPDRADDGFDLGL